jgi:hypothetical protein
VTSGGYNMTSWVSTEPVFIIGNGASAGSRSNAMTVLKNGNVGIGTAEPVATLEVKGQVKITGGTPGANKVLTSDTNGLATWQTPAAGGITQEVDTLDSVIAREGISTRDAAVGKLTVSGTATSEFAGPVILAKTSGNVGIGTTGAEFKLTLDKGATTPDGGILAIGTLSSGATLTTAGAGTRLIWYPRKAAFRAGYVNGTQWDNANVGVQSIAMGYSTKASGNQSTAMGNVTVASGSMSTAMGASTTASGNQSTAMGQSTTASGDYSTAMGNSTTANGIGSITMGQSTTAGGDQSTAMGYFTTASGTASTAMGDYTTAQPYASLAIGQYNVVNGDSNNWVATEPLFIIGNGTDEANRSNALTVLKNGNVGIGTTEATNAKLDVDGNIKIRGTGTELPTADASYRGVLYLLQGSGGNPDKLYLCMQKSDNATYQWVLVARGD